MRDGGEGARRLGEVGFEHVDTWIFDLDNTLYPPALDLFTQVDQRISTWIASFHGIDGLSARFLQKHYYRRHGTSLNGLMQEDGIDPAGFLDFVHDIDHSAIHPDHRLGAAIDALPGRKFIFTNGTVKHAEAITRRLGIDHLFEDVFDIVAAGYEPKPRRAPYDLFLARHGLAPTRSAMFEDMARNLEVPKEVGMRTVLVVGPPAGHDSREAWEHPPEATPAYVDLVTDDLAGLLERLPAKGRGG
jgi:putative hydrolase of the HAD superfamily